MFSVSWQVEVDVEQNFSDGLHIFTQGSYSSPMEIIIQGMTELCMKRTLQLVHTTRMEFLCSNNIPLAVLL